MENIVIDFQSMLLILKCQQKTILQVLKYVLKHMTCTAVNSAFCVNHGIE